MTLNEIVDIIKNLAAKHKKIKGFYTGLAHEVNNSAIQYPALRMSFPYKVRTFVSNTEDNDLISYEFTLNLLVNEAKVESTPTSSYELNINYNSQQNTLNEIDQPLVSENLLREQALEIMMQYIEGLRMLQGTVGYLVVNSYSIKSLERYANDFVTGVECTISITTDNNYKCESQANVLNEIWKEDSYFGSDPAFPVCPFPTDCQTILDNLTTSIRNNCILPTYDFSNSAVQSALDPQQVEDIEDWILPSGCSEVLTFIEPYMTGCVIPSVDYSIPTNQNALDPQQIEDLKDVVVPALDYTIGNDTDFNRFSPTQIDDLEERLIPQPPQYSMNFDGVIEYINVPHNSTINFQRTDTFSITAWVKVTNYGSATNQSVFTKRAGVNTAGYSMYFLNGDFYVYINNTAINAILVRTNGVVFTNGTWNEVGFSYTGNSNASGVVIYVNGLPVSMTTVTNALTLSIQNVSPIVIAGRFAVAAYLVGNIGYLRIWNIALNSTQMALDYNSGIMINRPIESANLVFGWRGGTDALWTGTIWVCKDESGTNINPSPITGNMEYIDRTTDVPT